MHKTETLRKYIDWALSAGRLFQSAQTGFIHYFYGSAQNGLHQAIPVYENAIFILALLRSRHIENIKEAQVLLGRLLAFQNMDSSTGSFPVYLHEYPNCRDFSLGVRLLAPFYYILVGFGHVLGMELRSILEKSVEKLLQYGLAAHQVRAFPYSLAVRLASGLTAFGELFNRADWSEIGKVSLLRLGSTAPGDSWCHTGHLEDVMIAAQMVPREFKLTHWNPFWCFVSDTWHSELGCYCGPGFHEKQEQCEPAVALYDLFLGYFIGKLPERAKKIKFVHVYGALVHAVDFEVLPASKGIVQGVFNSENWSCVKNANWAGTLLEKKHPLNEKNEKTFSPLKLFWGSDQVAHTLVVQSAKAKRVECFWDVSTADMLFDLDAHLETKMEFSREICFYFDIYPDLKITVNGKRANTFGLGQIVTLHLGENKEIQVVFELVGGKGSFLGHVAQANRPLQISQAGEKRPQIFDWILFLRTLRRSENCKVRVSVTFIAQTNV